MGFTEVDRLQEKVQLYPTRFMSESRILQTRSLPDIDFGYKRPTLTECQEICEMVDANKTGIIEFPEFRKLILKIFKAVYEARIQQEEEQRRREDMYDKDDYV